MAELVYGARLEIVYTLTGIKGSNPFLSATHEPPKREALFCVWRRESQRRTLRHKAQGFAFKRKP